MQRRQGVFGLGLALVLSLGAGAQEREPAPEPAGAGLERALGAALGVEGMPEDAALWVGSASGTLVESSHGRYERGTVVPLSSASQWLAAATLVRLADGGLLSLDDPLLEFFPNLDDDKIAITVRQLLAHTSGLVTHHPCLADAELTLEQCAERILAEPRAARPGTQLRYGAAAYQVAGRIAEIVTGESWSEIFASALGKPLGLEATGWPATRNPAIATGASGTASDYGRFLTMLLTGGEGPSGRVLEQASVAAMLSPQSGRARIVVSPLGDDAVFGLGAWITPIEGGELASCPGILGFTPWLDGAHGVAGALAILHPRRALTSLVGELQRLAAEAVQPASAAEPEAEAPPEASR